MEDISGRPVRPFLRHAKDEGRFSILTFVLRIAGDLLPERVRNGYGLNCGLA